MRSRSLVLFLALLVFGAAGGGTETLPARQVDIVIGRGELVQFDKDITRVAVAEPKIADAVVVSPREIMINAKGIGKTTIVVWETASLPQRFEISVRGDTADFERFVREIQAVIPDRKIRVSGTQESLLLEGEVGSTADSLRLEKLAATRAKTVVNLLKVPPPAEPRQILLEVKFASIDRAALTEVGFNLFSTNDKMLGMTSTQQFQAPRFSQLQRGGEGSSGGTVNFADLLNIFVFRPDLNIGATIKLLQSQNLLQVLAEPNLIVVEDKEASFLAGGSFPFPVLTSTSTGGAVSPVVTVQFKPFGVQLNFTPSVTPAGAIRLKVAPEVSSLDYANAVTLQGFLIPAITQRRAETEVILKDGESFAIAGLIDNRVIQTLSRVPGLGDIPILGYLFRSRSTKRTNDELLVVIRPRFVRPLAPEEIAKLPEFQETFLPPVSETKEGKKKAQKAQPKPQPEFVGPRGYQTPK